MASANTEKALDKARETLKSKGKDPDKYLTPEEPAEKPESQRAGTASSTETKKEADNLKSEEQTEKGKRTQQDEEAEKVQRAEDDALLSKEESTLTEDEKQRKKEVIALREAEKEAQRDARIQKRIDELTGQIKAEKAEREQDKKLISSLQEEINRLRGTVEKDPDKINTEVRSREAERIAKYLEEDKDLPREQRREMTREELDDWLIEDMVAAQEWIADRQHRRREERNEDVGALSSNGEAVKEAERILKAQAESSERVKQKHPDLDFTSLKADLEAQGKSAKEIAEIIMNGNDKAKLMIQIVQENPQKYQFAENGPELAMEEMEKRLAAQGKSGETDEEKEARIREEAAEAERQRQAELDDNITSTRGGESKRSSAGKDPMHDQMLSVWKKSFPHLSEKEVEARMLKRLNERRASGVV